MNLMKTSAVALSLALAGAPAMAQQAGLVNVNVEDIVLNDLLDVTVSDNVVAVPIGIAANVCPGVNVGAVASDLAQDTDPVCEATATSRAFENFLVQSGQATR